ncbi:hypothetical protein C8R44DRAFT_875787 [Mycena epipterygia]|nr:hypothetical protein C8R44DRAFT_875787 [Mycena epipterygia]
MRGSYFAFYALPPLLVCSKTLHLDKSIEMPIGTLFLWDRIMWFVVVFGIDGVYMLIWATRRATLTQTIYRALFTGVFKSPSNS